MPRAGRMTGAEREAFQLGRQHYERGDPTGALGYLTRVLDSCPRFESFEAALAINPVYVEALLALSSAYERAGDFDGSRALAERTGPAALHGSGVPPVEPGSPDPITRAKLANLHAGLGDAYCEVGDFREAVEAYRKALERCPTFHDIRQRLGMALREAGLGSQALEEFRRILRANPTYLDAAVQLGLTLYTMGRSREAIAEWKRVLNRDPSRESARMYLNLLDRAEG